VAWFLFAIAGLTFLFGGRAINEFAKTERVLAEMEGVGLAALCALLGTIAKAGGERLGEAEKIGPFRNFVMALAYRPPKAEHPGGGSGLPITKLGGPSLTPNCFG
jgi:hypothetical protein